MAFPIAQHIPATFKDLSVAKVVDQIVHDNSEYHARVNKDLTLMMTTGLMQRTVKSVRLQAPANWFEHLKETLYRRHRVLRRVENRWPVLYLYRYLTANQVFPDAKLDRLKPSIIMLIENSQFVLDQ